MSNVLERRLNKLEALRPDANQIDIIIHRIIDSPGNKFVRATFGDIVVDRRTDEAEDAFIERSKAEALAATTQRPCCMILLPELELQ